MSKLQTLLPVDVVAHVAQYVGDRGRYVMWGHSRKDLLALRVACRAARDAVTRAVKDHKTSEVIRIPTFAGHGRPGNSSAESIRARADFCGSGCRIISAEGVKSPEQVQAFRHLVLGCTQGRLHSMYLSDSAISADSLLELCRACPQLKHFRAALPCVTPENLQEVCVDVSRACPCLVYAYFHRRLHRNMSAAECYQMHFPRTGTIDLMRTGWDMTTPFRLDLIEATLQSCTRADELDADGSVISDELARMFLRAPLGRNLKELRLVSVSISPETILLCASGFESLIDLTLPRDFAASNPIDFCRRLVRARPTLTSLDLGGGANFDNACVRIVCDGLSLAHLDLSGLERLTPGVLDIIVESTSARTLRSVAVYAPRSEVQVFTSAAVLRLVRGCPELSDLNFDSAGDDYYWTPDEDGQNNDAIDKLIFDIRCGRFEVGSGFYPMCR